jgi:hypothetical protein
MEFATDYVRFNGRQYQPFRLSIIRSGSTRRREKSAVYPRDWEIFLRCAGGVHCAGRATASGHVATQLPKNRAVEQANCREIA